MGGSLFRVATAARPGGARTARKRARREARPHKNHAQLHEIPPKNQGLNSKSNENSQN
jgi:hypothetical protein